MLRLIKLLIKPVVGLVTVATRSMSVSVKILSPRAASAGGDCVLEPPPVPFKLRFAPQRQPGRSYVSPTKPMGLPAIVKDKFYRRDSEQETSDKLDSTLSYVRDMFRSGPREKYSKPVTSAQVYGWWWDSPLTKVNATDSRLRHHICDSSWMKEQLRVLAADASYKRL